MSDIEDIEKLKSLFYQNSLTQYGKRKLINYYEKRIQELEEENERWKRYCAEDLDKQIIDLNNKIFKLESNSIPKQVIKDKIEELKDKIEKYKEYRVLQKETDVEYYENIGNEIARDILEELLEGEKQKCVNIVKKGKEKGKNRTIIYGLKKTK